MIFVYSLGGFILAGRDPESLRQYVQSLKELAVDHQIFVVVGGGRIAREYIEKARAPGASERYRDEFDEAVQEAP
jgi:uridylate kinase